MSTIKVRKANRIIRVTENELDKYLADGYVVMETKVSQPSQTVVDKPKEAPKKNRTSSVRRKK